MLDYYFRSGYVIMSNGWHRRVRVSQKSKVFEKKNYPPHYYFDFISKLRGY